MGQTPKKYHIADDGKIYRINDDGSFTEMGNIEDINTKPEEDTPPPFDVSSYSSDTSSHSEPPSQYPPTKKTKRSGCLWSVIIVVVLLIAAIVTGVLIFIYSRQSVEGNFDSESIYMGYTEPVNAIDTLQAMPMDSVAETTAEATEAAAADGTFYPGTIEIPEDLSPRMIYNIYNSGETIASNSQPYVN